MRYFVLLLTLVGLAGLGLGCAPSALSAAPVMTDHVEMPKSYKFSPAVIEVEAGTTVTWHNDDNFTHSVQLMPGGKPLIAQPGQSVHITFDKPGEYNYICTFHPNDMKGKVIVVAKTPNTTPSP